MTDEEIVKKIDSKEKLTEQEIENLIYESEQVYEEEGDDHRWTRDIFTVVKLCGRYFGIYWSQGLTECQENEYYDQPFEVACENKTEVVRREIWKPIDEVKNNSEKDLIVVKQLPVIEEQLRTTGVEIDKKVNEVLSLVCTEETVKTVKEIRASLNKELKDFEDRRKQVKTEVMKPYEDFEKIYKECISDKYKKADLDLKAKVDSVENELKANKKTEVENYFNEYLKSKGIDFVTFEDTKINVTLSASMKSLKEQAKSFIDKIADDLNLIDTQEHKAEILVEYKQSLNVSQAITTVNDRFKAIEEEKAKLEIVKESDKDSNNYVPTIEEVPQMALEAPTIVEIDEILTLKFTVRGTRTQLKALKEFLEKGNYDYE